MGVSRIRQQLFANGHKPLNLVIGWSPHRNPHVYLTAIVLLNLYSQVIYQISSIINYISHSPLGSLRILRLKSEDFVVVGDQIKLSDLDDLVVGEHACSSEAQCYEHLKNKAVPGIQCLKKKCVGLNEKLNLKMVSDHMLLPLMVNVPPQSKKAISVIIGQLQSLQISTEYLVDIFTNMLAKAG
eukprot:XP_014789357.1 PREDICTED: uncharacterized protein LOC106883010 [Octopus bimaculoides]